MFAYMALNEYFTQQKTIKLLIPPHIEYIR